MSEFELPKDRPELVRVPNWLPFWRRLAIVMWSGFLGASLMLLSLLVAWERLQLAGSSPGWTILALAFVVGWVVTAITAVMALSLADEPRSQLRPGAGGPPP